MDSQLTPLRRCLACGLTEAVESGEPIWPLGWHCTACGHRVSESDGIPAFAPDVADAVSGIDPGLIDDLAKLEADYFWFVARNALVVGLIGKFFPDARSFLDIGCGSGSILQAIALSRTWERLAGTELHLARLFHARKRLPSVEFAQMDARAIPARNAFDITGAFDVIEHIEDDEGVLRGMRGATRSGGGIVIAVPQHPWLWSRADVVAHHQRRYRRGELEAKLRSNGFQVLFSSSYTALLLPLMAANRLRNQRSETDDELDEFRLRPRINKLFTAILQLEVRMTLAGVRWPAGGSRIVVARAV